MKKTLSIFLILISLSRLQAQHIYLCKAYTETGEPIDLIYSKELVFNQSVCLLLNAGNKKISESSVFLFIDKITSTGRQNQFNKVFKVEKGKNWIAQPYKFIKDGQFEIYFTDANQNRLAFTKVIVAPLKTSGTVPITSASASSTHPNAEVVFCEMIMGGLPILIKQTLSFQKNNPIYIFLKNNSPLDTERISVRVFRKSKYSSDYDEFVGTKKYKVNYDWADTYFRYKFDKPGEYKINIHDEKEILIKTAYISVVN